MSPSATRFLVPALVLLFSLGASPRPLSAQEDLKNDLKKVFGEAQEKALSGVLEVIERRTKERIAKLEEELKSRDKKIADLEAKVKELSQAAAKPAPQPAPEPKRSNTFLGVGHMDVPPDVRAKIKVDGGALVTQVLEESPAAAAGIQVGDVIVDVNGTPITSANLVATLSGFKPDQEVNISYFHDGNRATKAIKLGDRDKYEATARAKREPAPAKKEPVVLGVMVQEQDGGLIVDSVEDGLTGSVAGLKKGDKITQLNGKDLKTIEDISGELKKVLEGEKFQLIFLRGDETVTLSLVGSRGKDGAKVLARDAKKPQPKEGKPAQLGVAVIPEAGGVGVESIVADTAAAAAGIKKGDIIKKANGQAIADVDALKTVLSKLRSGDKLSLELAREGQPVELKDLVLKGEGEKVEAPKPAEPAKPANAPKKKGALGIYATEITDPQNQVVVKTVNPGGPAEKADLKVGDVLLKINGKDVRSFDDVANVLQPLFAGDEVTLRVKRGNDEKDLKVTLGEAAG